MSQLILAGLDPNFSSFRKFFIETIHRKIVTSENAVNVFENRYLGRIVTKVEVCGLVTRLQRKTKKVTVRIDDGTGVIDCIKYTDPDNLEQDATPFPHLQIGDLVTIKGDLRLLESNTENYRFHLRIKCINVLTDPNLESLYWTSTILLHEKEYCQEFQKSPALSLPIDDEMHSNPLLHCSCCLESTLPNLHPSSSSSSSSSAAATVTALDPAKSRALRVKEELLYCKCICSPCPQDTSGEFRVNLLHRLIRYEQVLPDECVLEMDLQQDILEDKEILGYAMTLVESKHTNRLSEPLGIFTTSVPTSTLCDHLDVNLPLPPPSSSMANMKEKARALIESCCKTLIKDGILFIDETATAGKLQLVSVSRVIVPLLKAVAANYTDASDYDDVDDSVIEDALLSYPRIPKWRLRYCYYSNVKTS